MIRHAYQIIQIVQHDEGAHPCPLDVWSPFISVKQSFVREGSIVEMKTYIYQWRRWIDLLQKAFTIFVFVQWLARYWRKLKSHHDMFWNKSAKMENIERVKDDKTFENENTLKFLSKERGCILSLEFHATRPPHCFVFNILYFVLSLCSSLRIPLSPSSWFCITQCYI